MIIKIQPDKQKAKSILYLTEGREKFSKTINPKLFPTILAENYYEIAKELATAHLLLDGYKTKGENAHKETIEFLSKYKIIKKSDISILQDLRIKRNLSSYEGKQIPPIYLENNKQKILEIILKLKQSLKKKLK